MTEHATDTLAILRESLPERITRFCERYLANGCDAAEAAHHVGAPGEQRALLTDRRALTYIAALTGQIRDANRHVREQIVGMLAQMAMADPKDAVRAGSMQLRSMDEMPDAVRMCIEGWEVKPDGSFKIRFVKKLDIIRLLLEMTGDVGPSAHGGQASGVRIIFEKARQALPVKATVVDMAKERT